MIREAAFGGKGEVIGDRPELTAAPNSGMVAGMSIAPIIDELRAYLLWTRDEGVTEVGLSEQAAHWIHTMADTKPHPATRREPPPRPAAPTPEATPPKPPPAPRKPPSPSPAAATIGSDDPLPAPAGDSLERIAAEISRCTRCPLHAGRTNTVPGQGCQRPEILFVGEAPGADEDRQGLAFVGRAGQLLTKMIAAMGLSREEVFIANINKCRPPDNRAPTQDEMAACLPYLQRQIACLQPKVIIAMGATALNGLVEVPKGVGITKLRGTWLRFHGIDLMPTFHPSYLLRNPPAKRPVWEDLQAVLRRLNRPIPPV